MRNSNIPPLDNFFVRLALHQRPILRITNNMKSYIDKAFADILNAKMNSDGQLTKDILLKIRTRINICLDKDELRNFFVGSGTHSPRSNTENPIVFVTLGQPYYSHLFLMIYLAQLYQFTTSLSCKANECDGKNAGYVMSVEKNLLDDIFGSKMQLRKMLFGSSIVQEEDDHTKVRVVVLGEGILQAIQCKLNIDLALKSYFVVAQLQPTNVYVSLNQVVKIASSEEDVSAIIVKDKLVPFENVIHTLCKTIWNHFLSTGTIDYCPLHKDEYSIDCSLFQSKNYHHALEKLKYHLVTTVSIPELQL